MSDPKLDKGYARRKLALVLRDLNDYTSAEFWREISRIASGATGLPSAEQLQAHAKELEAELAAARAGWQETIAKMASQERPAYDDQQQRIAKLEAINLGLTKTLVDMNSEKVKLVEALDDIGASWHGVNTELEKYMRNVARRALAACRKGGEE